MRQKKGKKTESVKAQMYALFSGVAPYCAPLFRVPGIYLRPRSDLRFRANTVGVVSEDLLPTTRPSSQQIRLLKRNRESGPIKVRTKALFDWGGSACAFIRCNSYLRWQAGVTSWRPYLESNVPGLEE